MTYLFLSQIFEIQYFFLSPLFYTSVAIYTFKKVLKLIFVYWYTMLIVNLCIVYPSTFSLFS